MRVSIPLFPQKMHYSRHPWSSLKGSCCEYEAEFSETPNQAYFYAYFWFCTRTFPAGDSNFRQFFFSVDASQTP